jgi:phospholipid/cholesterol/gamma-HCH transport system substrate-binding protein
MKTGLSTEFKVGLTVVISTLILIFGIIWGKEFRLKTNKYQLTVLFDNVGGMVVGDPVTVNGVKEGKILEIGWEDRDVLCRIELNDHVQLYEDATFTVISAELLAGMKIEIFPGKSSEHINLSQQPFRGKYGGRIVDVGLVIGELAEDLSALSFRIDTTITMINALLEGGGLQKDLQQSLNNLNRLTGDLRTVPTDLRYTMSSLDTLLANINNLIDQNKEPVHNALGNFNAVASRLDTVASSLQMVMNKIENQEGSLGKLVHDPQLVDHLNRTLLSIDSLAQKFKKEGVKISLF